MSVSGIDILGIISQFYLNTWNYSWKIRRHHTLELIICADTAISSVS